MKRGKRKTSQEIGDDLRRADVKKVGRTSRWQTIGLNDAAQKKQKSVENAGGGIDYPIQSNLFKSGNKAHTDTHNTVHNIY